MGSDGGGASATGIDGEIEAYRANPKRKLYWDPLRFWADYRFEYPLLYKVAIRLLGAPATSVKSEQVWSHAGRINTPARERLSMASLNRLLFLQ